MFTTLIVFQVLIAAGLIAIVLVQRGPGATMGAAFGAGASGTVFGSRGAGNFLTRTTSWLAVGFFGISLALAVLATSLSSRGGDESALSGSVMERQEQPAQTESGSGLESAIESLDDGSANNSGNNPGDLAGDQSAAAESAGEAASSESSQDDDGTLPEPPAGN